MGMGKRDQANNAPEYLFTQRASKSILKLAHKIVQLVREGKQVTVSFANVTMLVSLFLNVAIGQLYGSFDEQQIRNQLKVEGLAPDDMELLKRVVDNAKKYYPNKKAYDDAWKRENEGEE